MSRTRSIRTIGISIIILSVFAAAGLWIWQSQKESSSGDVREAEPVLQTATGVNPLLIETSDALTRAVNTAKTSKMINEADIHLPEAIDWNSEFLVALQFSALAARPFMGAQIETVNGEKTYVIDLQDVPQGCIVSDVNTTRMVFVKQTSRDTSLPVIIRITANTASCPL